MQLTHRFRNSWDMVLLCLLLLATPIGVGVLSIVGAAHYGSEIYKAYVSSRDWQPTVATVLKASVTKDCGSGRFGYSYSLNVVYSYEVENQPYSSDRIWFGNGPCSGKAQVESQISKFKLGARMIVYYDAHQPSQAVLYRGNIENGSLLLFLLLVMLTFGCLWWLVKLLVGVKNGRSNTDQIDSYLRSRLRVYDVSVRKKIDG